MHRKKLDTRTLGVSKPNLNFRLNSENLRSSLVSLPSSVAACDKAYSRRTDALKQTDAPEEQADSARKEPKQRRGSEEARQPADCHAAREQPSPLPKRKESRLATGRGDQKSGLTMPRKPSRKSHDTLETEVIPNTFETGRRLSKSSTEGEPDAA